MQGGAVCCRIALGLLFCSSWTSLGRPWSPTWSVLGASRAPLGVSWAPLGRLWSPTWSLLGVSWSVLSSSWSVLGSSWTFKLLSKGSKMAFGAPSWALHSQHELQLALQLPFQSTPDLQNHKFSLQKLWFLQGGAVCCRVALGLLFCSSWTSLGRLWSPTSSLLDASWRVLGSSGRQLRSLGALLAALGTLLAALGALLAALGTLLGRSWDALGTLLVALGCSWSPKRPSWDILGSI